VNGDLDGIQEVLGGCRMKKLKADEIKKTEGDSDCSGKIP
jgi:hypothetical protein